LKNTSNAPENPTKEETLSLDGFPYVEPEDRFVPLVSDLNLINGKRYGKYGEKYRCVDCGINYNVDAIHKC